MRHHKVSWLATIGIITALSAAHGEIAPYQVTFQGLWNAQDHPTNFPSGDHFSPLIGGTHNDTVSFWEVGAVVGTTASPGIENMAESGSTSQLESDFNDEINTGRANTIIRRALGGDGMTSATIDFEVDSSHPLVTLVSMVAPSPDWFVGVTGLNLLDEQGNWRPHIAADLYVHDAGTEDGSTFSTGHPNTSPHVAITQLHGSEVDDDVFPFVSAPRIATLTFTLVPEPASLAILVGGTVLCLRRRRRAQI